MGKIKKMLFVGGWVVAVTACTSVTQPPTEPLACDDSIKQYFKPDEQTSVVLVKAFKKGEKLALRKDNAKRALPAMSDICLVKLNVGPGNPGPADAPSTSKGIGIEIWLPSHDVWNERIHASGGGGWQGGGAGSADYIGAPYSAMIAMQEHAVASTTNAGHETAPMMYGVPLSNGDFMMLPDGSINTTLWEDFSNRAIHEQAVKTRQLTQAYYGKPARYAYFEGSSLGGRQAHKLAQRYPDDYDGIIGNMPALYWTRLLPTMAYPHIVMQNDLAGNTLSKAQLDLASNAAIEACDEVGGVHLGYIMDNASCDYDPALDKAVLCAGNGGTNNTEHCLTPRQAVAINKMWYGTTVDGSAPVPAVDNGWDSTLSDKRLWFGPARGTSLWNRFFSGLFGISAGVANPEGPFFLSSDQLALQLQDPSIAEPSFINAQGNGRNGWKSLTYSQMADALNKGVALNDQFAQIDTNNPDLSAFKARGGKFLAWHGINDEVIPVQGTVHYYQSVVEEMGGLEAVQEFYRLYLVPGVGHESPNGTANAEARPPLIKPGQLYGALVKWVEEGIAPGRIEMQSGVRSQPACAYPQAAQYVGGDVDIVSSYRCR